MKKIFNYVIRNINLIKSLLIVVRQIMMHLKQYRPLSRIITRTHNHYYFSPTEITLIIL